MLLAVGVVVGALVVATVGGLALGSPDSPSVAPIEIDDRAPDKGRDEKDAKRTPRKRVRDRKRPTARGGGASSKGGTRGEGDSDDDGFEPVPAPRQPQAPAKPPFSPPPASSPARPSPPPPAPPSDDPGDDQDGGGAETDGGDAD